MGNAIFSFGFARVTEVRHMCLSFQFLMTIRNAIGLKFLIRGKINILQKLRDGWNMSSKKHEYNHKKNVADFPFH